MTNLGTTTLQTTQPGIGKSVSSSTATLGDLLTYTLRVPADQLESALEQLEALAITVRGRTVNREDVTEQYSDIDAQLRNLQATENELREMLAEVRAKPNAKPEDILAVHRELTAIRSQIDTPSDAATKSHHGTSPSAP